MGLLAAPLAVPAVNAGRLRHMVNDREIKAVVFDFGQTLADSSQGFRTAEAEAQKRLFSYLGKTSWGDFIAIYREIRKTRQDSSDFSRKDMWVQVCSRYGAASDRLLFEQLEKDYWNTVEAQTELFPEALSTLKELAARYRLALITNTQGQEQSGNHRISRFPSLKPLFREIIVAGGGGLPPKPHPAPFRHCVTRLDLYPREVVFVGDDWRIDICGAGSIGMQPIWLKHHSVKRSWPSVTARVPVITSLEELLGLESLLRAEGAEWRSLLPPNGKNFGAEIAAWEEFRAGEEGPIPLKNGHR